MHRKNCKRFRSIRHLSAGRVTGMEQQTNQPVLPIKIHPADVAARGIEQQVDPRDTAISSNHLVANSVNDQDIPKKPIYSELQTPVTEPLTASESKSKMSQVVSESNEVLDRAKTVFPFDLFPDEVIVDRTKVTIVSRVFFGMADTRSIRIEDIMSAGSTTVVFLGTLTITTRVNNQEEQISVRPLFSEDAFRLKQLIQGYVITLQRGIDMSKLSVAELKQTISEMGKYDEKEATK